AGQQRRLAGEPGESAGGAGGILATAIAMHLAPLPLAGEGRRAAAPGEGMLEAAPHPPSAARWVPPSPASGRGELSPSSQVAMQRSASGASDGAQCSDSLRSTGRERPGVVAISPAWPIYQRSSPAASTSR